VWAHRSDKFLEMIFWRLCLAFEVTFSRRYRLLAGVTASLVVATIAGYYGDMEGSPLLPFLAALGAFPSALSGGLGWYGSATTGDHFRIA
jgi:hypothetical protein